LKHITTAHKKQAQVVITISHNFPADLRHNIMTCGKRENRIVIYYFPGHSVDEFKLKRLQIVPTSVARKLYTGIKIMNFSKTYVSLG